MRDIILKVQAGRAWSPLLSMGQVLYQPLLPSVLAGKGEISLILVPVSPASPDGFDEECVFWDFPWNIIWRISQPHMVYLLHHAYFHSHFYPFLLHLSCNSSILTSLSISPCLLQDSGDFLAAKLHQPLGSLPGSYSLYPERLPPTQ